MNQYPFGLKRDGNIEIGDRVRVMDCSGIGSGKHGIVLSWNNPLSRTVKVTYPFCGGHTPQGMGWVAVKLDEEIGVTSYPVDRLIRMPN